MLNTTYKNYFNGQRLWSNLLNNAPVQNGVKFKSHVTPIELPEWVPNHPYFIQRVTELLEIASEKEYLENWATPTLTCYSISLLFGMSLQPIDGEQNMYGIAYDWDRIEKAPFDPLFVEKNEYRMLYSIVHNSDRFTLFPPEHEGQIAAIESLVPCMSELPAWVPLEPHIQTVVAELLTRQNEAYYLNEFSIPDLRSRADRPMEAIYSTFPVVVKETEYPMLYSAEWKNSVIKDQINQAAYKDVQLYRILYSLAAHSHLYNVEAPMPMNPDVLFYIRKNPDNVVKAIKPNVVFTYGRFNPPHIGHRKLIEAIIAKAAENNADAYVFVTSTQDAESNPLIVSEKVRLLKLMFPNSSKVRIINTTEQNCRKIENVLELFEAEKYEKKIFFVGGDRYNKFKNMFPGVNVVSYGERTEANASSTQMRMAALADDYASVRALMDPRIPDAIVRETMQVIQERMRSAAAAAAAPELPEWVPRIGYFQERIAALLAERSIEAYLNGYAIPELNKRTDIVANFPVNFKDIGSRYMLEWHNNKLRTAAGSRNIEQFKKELEFKLIYSLAHHGHIYELLPPQDSTQILTFRQRPMGSSAAAFNTTRRNNAPRRNNTRRNNAPQRNNAPRPNNTRRNNAPRRNNTRRNNAGLPVLNRLNDIKGRYPVVWKFLDASNKYLAIEIHNKNFMLKYGGQKNINELKSEIIADLKRSSAWQVEPAANVGEVCRLKLN